MTPAELKSARKQMHLTQSALAKALGLSPANGARSVRAWEKEGNTVPGPVAVAVRYMVEHGPVFHGRNV